MAFEKGGMYTCDRCGAQEFAELISVGELDGGFTHKNTFVKLEGWSRELDIGDLCPACSAAWQHIKQRFKDGHYE
jgi:hypothetical protein